MFIKHFSIICILFALLFSSLALAENNKVNVDQTGIAIHGYDPVAYFYASKAILGKPDFSYEWSGATWQFSNQVNLDRFIKNPRHFAPQYGGFCAYAASYGQYADVDPLAWTIVNNKLYLNYSMRVRQTWRPRAEEFIGDADQLWLNMNTIKPDF